MASALVVILRFPSNMLQKGSSHTSDKGLHVVGIVQRRHKVVHLLVRQHDWFAFDDGPEFVIGRLQTKREFLIGLGSVKLSKGESGREMRKASKKSELDVSLRVAL